MRTLIAFCCLMVSVVAQHARADDDPDIEALWTQWQAGEKGAWGELWGLGPDARVLAHRLLYPDGTSFPEAPEGEGWFLVEAMEADAVPELVKAIKKSFTDDRIRLIELLPKNPMAAPAADVLLDIAIEEHDELREAAIAALAHAHAKPDYVIPELIRLAKQSDWSSGTRTEGSDRTADSAVNLLADFPDKRALSFLQSAVRFHPSAIVRESAIRALAENSKQRPWIRHSLVESLDDGAPTGTGAFGSGNVADQAMDAILHFPELRADTAAPLIGKLYRQSFEEWTISVDVFDLCEAICRCPMTDDDASELIHRKLRPLLEPDAYIRDDAEDIRVAAASVVLKWNPADRAAAEHLVTVLREETERDFSGPKGSRFPDIRAQAARGFERIGPAAGEWLPLLHKVMDRELERHPGSELAFATAWAIANIDPEDTDCLRVLKNANDEWYQRGLSWEQVTGVLGTRVALLTDLGQMLKQLQDSDFVFDNSDEEWFWLRLQPHAESVVPAIAQHFDSDDIVVRAAAVEALGYLRANTAVPQLIEHLHDSRAVVRAAAAKALGEYGPAARDAIPALREATGDDYLTVKYRAGEALAAIDAKTVE